MSPLVNYDKGILGQMINFYINTKFYLQASDDDQININNIRVGKLFQTPMGDLPIDRVFIYHGEEPSLHVNLVHNQETSAA